MPEPRQPEGEEGYLEGVTADQSQETAAADTTPAPLAEDAKPKSMLEAVQKAVAETDEVDGASSSSDDAEPVEGEGEAEEAVAEAPEEGATAEEPPFHKHPRWQELKAERDQYREKAQVAEQLQGYMSEAGLNTDDVNQGFSIMALIKSDPAKALEALMPIVQELQGHTGERLPADLQEAVDGGFTDEKIARELAKARADKARGTATAQEREAADRRTTAQSAAIAVSKWESDWSGADPDYGLKKGRVLEKIELSIRREGPPKSAEAAVAIAEKARAEVTKELEGLRPKKKPIVPASGDTTASGGSSPKPMTMLDVVRQGVRAAQ